MWNNKESESDAAWFTGLQIPNSFTIAAKLGYSIPRVLAYEKFQCISTDRDRQNDIADVKASMKQNFPERISFKAFKNLYDTRFQKPKAISLAADILLLFNYFKAQVLTRQKALEDDSTNTKRWFELWESAVGHIIFKRRRLGVMSRLPLAQYLKAKATPLLHDDIQASLSHSERLIAKSVLPVNITSEICQERSAILPQPARRRQSFCHRQNT